MEIEAKFAIIRQLDATMLPTLDLRPYTLQAPEDEQHHDVIMDTPSRTLTGQRLALRVRRKAQQTLVTLKGPNTGSGGTHEREELEAPLDGSFDEHDTGSLHWPEPIAARIGPLLGAEPLQPLVTVDIHRQTWRVERDGQEIGELALDAGAVSADGRSEPIHELELELKGKGTRADLEVLARRLGELLPLRPESQSKLERGLALLEHPRQHERHTPLAIAGKRYVRKLLRKLHESEPAARAGADPEGVHKMRVAARRLRTTLRVLEDAEVFPARELARYRRGLRKLARALGAVRDLDVFLARVERYAAAQSDSSADLDVLRQELARQHRAARARLHKQLDSPKLARLLSRLEAFAREPERLSDAETRLLVRHFAGGVLWARYEQVLRFETELDDASPMTLHALRIACKRMRYTLEIFHKALGKRAEPLTAVLMQAQDHLGDLHDTAVALDVVGSLIATHPEARKLTLYAASLAAQRDELRRTFTPIWEEISGAPFRRDLAGAIARL